MKKWYWLIIVGAVAFLSVVIAFVMGNRIDFSSLRENVAKIAETKPAVEAFLDGETKSLELGETEKKLAQDFENAVNESAAQIKKAEKAPALKDEEVEKLYTQAKGQLSNLERTLKAWQDLQALTGGEADFETLAKSENEKLKAFAEDMLNYRKEVAAFEQKYTKGNNELIEAYSDLQKKGDDLAEKYGKMGLAEITGMSRDEIMSFYATIEELESLLNKKK